MRHSRIFLLLFLSSLIGLSPAIASDGESHSKTAISLDFNGNPAPCSLGLNLYYRPARNFRLSLGSSYYNDAILANTAMGAANLVFRPLLFLLADLFVVIFSGGTDHLIYGHFLGHMNYLSPDKTGYAVGSGFDYLAPLGTTSIVPYIGAHASYYSTAGSKPAFSSSFSGIAPYVTTGIDLGPFGAGYNLCPTLYWGSCGWFVHVLSSF